MRFVSLGSPTRPNVTRKFPVSLMCRDLGRHWLPTVRRPSGFCCRGFVETPRALWGLIAGDQGLHWWTKKPYRPIFRGNGCSIPIKRGGRYQRIYLKRGRRSFKGYGRF